MRERPVVLHCTTTDMSLALLLGPQLRAFRDAGFDVHAASAPGPWVTDLEADGVTFHPLASSTRAMAPTRDLRAAAELWSLFRRLRPDIVHTHNPKPGVYGRLTARLAGVPRIVNTQHGLYAQPEDPRRRRWPVYALERLAAAAGHVELVQSAEDLATLRDRLHVPSRKLVRLGNGIDLGRFRPPSDDERRAARAELGIADTTVVVGAVGRLVWEKGYRELFAAVAPILASDRDVRVLVIGPDDPDKDDLLRPEDLERARRDGVEFLGMRDDVDRCYRAMDLYVLASHREGYPRSAMEAAACGLPVVATDIRGCREVVDHGRTGVLTPVRDPEALRGAIEALVDDPDRRAAMARAAVDRAASHFDQRQVIATTLAAYA